MISFWIANLKWFHFRMSSKGILFSVRKELICNRIQNEFDWKRVQKKIENEFKMNDLENSQWIPLKTNKNEFMDFFDNKSGIDFQLNSFENTFEMNSYENEF